ncbi:MAG: hypothetical protein HQL18_04210, partial [Candidatus Omnitrophica bacterium]|nr:hypothetical protein [Candidatus Omnitrophota bacterium]
LASKLVPALGFVAVACSLAAMVLTMPRRQQRWAALGAAWFVIALLPSLNIVPLINEYALILASEHFLYLPLAGALILGVVAGVWSFRLIRGEVSRPFCQGCFAFFVLALS